MYMIVKRGQIPPSAVFEAATKECREAFGIAVAHENDIILQTGVLDWDDEKAALKQLVDYAEAYKEGVRMFWFSDAVVATEQPFTLFEAEVEEDGKTVTSIQTVAAFDGDYEKHDDANSSESPEFLCFTNIVKPRAEEIAGKVECDIDAFNKYINENKQNSDAFTKDVLSDTAAFCLLFSNGLVSNYDGSNALTKEFPWGIMSNPCGYTEAAETKIGTDPKKKIGLLPKGVTKNLSAEMDKSTGKITLISMHPPKAVKSSKDLVKWYQVWNFAKTDKGFGIVPENFAKRPAVEVDKAKWEAEFRPGNTPAGTATAVPASSGQDKTALLGKSAPATPSAGKSGVHHITFNPVLSALAKAELTGGWLREGFINDSATATTTLAAEEYKVPTFAENTGVSLNDLLRHTPTSINYLVRKHEDLATNLIIELLRLCEQKGVIAPAATKSPVPAGKPGKMVLKPKAA